jgi:hypothetical protein
MSAHISQAIMLKMIWEAEVYLETFDYFVAQQKERERRSLPAEPNSSEDREGEVQS